MMKKTKITKKNSIAKTIIRACAEFLVMMVFAIIILGMFAGAYLQESYRLNPPAQAERAEHPVLIRFLAGGEE